MIFLVIIFITKGVRRKEQLLNEKMLVKNANNISAKR